VEERCGEGDGEIARRRSGSEVQGALRALAAVLHDGRSSHLRHDRERGDEAGGEAVRGKGEHGEIEADHGNHDAFEVSEFYKLADLARTRAKFVFLSAIAREWSRVGLEREHARAAVPRVG